MNIGDIVIEKDTDRDLGLVVGHHTDRADGTIYNRVKWLAGRFVGHTDYIETECLDLLC